MTAKFMKIEKFEIV